MRKNIVINNLNEHLKIIQKQYDYIDESVNELSKILIKKIKKRGKIFICGNGGSAADSQHFATELIVRLKKNGKSIPAIALTTDSSILTATGNDYNFEKIFSRQIEAIANKSDVVIAISTSGNSKNIIEALKISKKKKIYTVGLLGNNGGKCKKHCDFNFTVKSNSPSRIQEIHIIFYQSLCEILENNLR